MLSHPVATLITLACAWCVWMTPFFRMPKRIGAQTIDKRARWGSALEVVWFALVWSRLAWAVNQPAWRWFAAVPFLIVGPLLSWTSARTLGRQWRFDAGLNADHRLVQDGAYRFIRHPIYASMHAQLLGTGLLITRLAFLGAAVVFFVAGTEIRAHRGRPPRIALRRRVPRVSTPRASLHPSCALTLSG